jgi:predicted negative regulator of RcsB-dependent stress response
VVKRIKKRIAKADDPNADDELGEGGELNPEATVDLRDELASMAEDDFTRRIAGGFQWILDHQRLLIAGAAVVIVGLVGYTLMQRSTKAANAEASGSFQRAADTYMEAYEIDTSAAQRGQAPKAKLDATERKARIEKARQGFAATQTAYSKDRIANLAALGLAGAEHDLGKPAEAVKLYDQVAGNTALDPFARAVALQGKAVALEDKGDKKGAIEAWNQVADLDKASFGLLAGVQVGRLLNASGDSAGATKQYKSLKTEYGAELDGLSGRQFKAEIDRRLAELGEAS